MCQWKTYRVNTMWVSHSFMMSSTLWKLQKLVASQMVSATPETEIVLSRKRKSGVKPVVPEQLGVRKCRPLPGSLPGCYKSATFMFYAAGSSHFTVGMALVTAVCQVRLLVLTLMQLSFSSKNSSNLFWGMTWKNYEVQCRWDWSVLESTSPMQMRLKHESWSQKHLGLSWANSGYLYPSVQIPRELARSSLLWWATQSACTHWGTVWIIYLSLRANKPCLPWTFSKSSLTVSSCQKCDNSR